MRLMILCASLLLAGCGDPGPTPSEIAKHKADKDCSKLYAGLTKVLQDELRKKQVKPVLGERPGFVELCAEQDFTEAQLKCMDPNLGGTEECKKELEAVADKRKKLNDYLLKPMMDKGKKKDEPAPAEGEEKPAEAPK